MESSKLRSTRILFIFRDPSRRGKSVEEIYQGIMLELSKSMEVCSFSYDDTKSIFNNCRAIRSFNASIVHITSDIYHIVPFIPHAKKLITIHDLGRFKQFKGLK